jgi:hypothetical protein
MGALLLAAAFSGGARFLSPYCQDDASLPAGLSQSGRGPWLAGVPRISLPPCFTGDMSSSGAAVNAIVGGSGREAVVSGSVLAHVLKTTPSQGERRPGGVGCASATIAPFT